MELTHWIGMVIAAFVGWTLSELSNRLAFKRQTDRERHRLKIDTYAEWIDGMENRLRSYAQQTLSPGASEVSFVEARLLLIERDEAARQLVREVQQSLPDCRSEDYEELVRAAHADPDWDWPLFRERMSALLDYVRANNGV